MRPHHSFSAESTKILAMPTPSHNSPAPHNAAPAHAQAQQPQSIIMSRIKERQDAADRAKQALTQDFTTSVAKTTALTQRLYELDVEWVTIRFHRKHAYPIIELFVAFTLCVACGASSYRTAIKIWQEIATFIHAALPNLPVDKADPTKARAPSYEGLHKMLLRMSNEALEACLKTLEDTHFVADLQQVELPKQEATAPAEAKSKSGNQSPMLKRDYISLMFQNFGLVTLKPENK